MIAIEKKDGCTVVRPDGDLVASHSDELRASLLTAIGDGSSDVLIDMVSARLIDSLGISTIIAAHNSFGGRPGKLRLVNVNDDIRGLLRLMRLDQHIQIS